MLKNPRVRTLMDSQHIKGSKRLLKSAKHYFCQVSWSFWKEISSKSSVLVVSEILRLFVNILTPDDKYSLSVKASVQRKRFKWNYLNIKKFEYFERKDEPQRWFLSEIIDRKKRCYLNA